MKQTNRESHLLAFHSHPTRHGQPARATTPHNMKRKRERKRKREMEVGMERGIERVREEMGRKETEKENQSRG